MKINQLMICFAVTLIALSNPVLAQDDNSKESEVETHFKVTMGVSLGFNGLSTFYSLGLVDENDFSYDVISVLNPETAKEIGLSDDQYNEILAISRSIKKELTDEFTQDAFEVDKAKFEAKFKAAESEMMALMKDEQLQRFDNVRHQMGIRGVGLGKYLASSHFKGQFQLSESQQKKLGSISKKINSEAKKLLRIANEKLLKQLSKKQLETISEILGPDFEEKFVNTNMFTKLNLHSSRPTKRDNSLVRFARSIKVRKKLGVTDSEYARIKKLKMDQVEKLSEILSEEQIQELKQLAVSADLGRMGTVHSLCGGFLKDVADCDSEKAAETYKAAKEIYESMLQDFAKAQQVAFSSVIDELPRETRTAIADSVGELSRNAKLSIFGDNQVLIR